LGKLQVAREGRERRVPQGGLKGEKKKKVARAGTKAIGETERGGEKFKKLRQTGSTSDARPRR